MPDIAKALREEIARVARREAKALIRPTVEQVRTLRRTVSEQKQTITQLRRELRLKADKTSQAPALTQDEGSTEKSVRISPGSVKKHRERLRLSQRQMGLLLGVSTLTVRNWESAKANPRGQNRLAIDQLRKMGIREVVAMLEKAQEEAGKESPQRKTAGKERRPSKKATKARKASGS